MTTPIAVAFSDSPADRAAAAAFMASMAARINEFWAQYDIANVAIDLVLWADDGPDLPPVVSVQTSPGEATDGQLTVMRLRAWMAANKRKENK